MKRVNIQLEDETHTKAKVIAVLKDMTLNEYFEKAIKEAVERDQTILNKIKTSKQNRSTQRYIKMSVQKNSDGSLESMNVGSNVYAGSVLHDTTIYDLVMHHLGNTGDMCGR